MQQGQDELIGHFGKYHNTLCLSPQILHKHCFQFLLGLTVVPRENKNNAYAKLGGRRKKSIMVFSELAYDETEKNNCSIIFQVMFYYGIALVSS